MMASATSTLTLDSSSAIFRRPNRPCLLPESVKNWKHHNERLHTWKAIPGCTLCLIKDNSEACCKIPDESCPVQSLRPDFLRRAVLCFPTALLAASFCDYLKDEKAMASEFADMPALRGKDYGKSKMRFPDYAETQSGLQYKDLRKGTGSTPKEGETVVVDWDGYTIGYYGRIFEARNKAKGGSFEGNDKDYLRFRLGTHEVIPAFEEAILTMNLGGVRRIIVPPELGYPDNDFNKKGPRPTTFSGQRALDFVLRNQGLIDKTLLFDIELLKISPT